MSMKVNRKVVVSICLSLCLIVGISAAAFYFTDSHSSKKVIVPNQVSCLESNGSALNGLPKNPSSNDIMNKLKDQQVNVTDKLSSSISFPNGNQGTEGQWLVENLPKNNVIMQCEVYLNNSLIARSASIYPDQHIEHITLLRAIKSGSYDVIAYINYYDLNTKQYISKAGYKIKMIVA